MGKAEISPEIKGLIFRLRDQQHITPREAKVLGEVFSCETRIEAAKRLNWKVGSVYKVITDLIRRGVLIKIAHGVFKLSENPVPLSRPDKQPPKQVEAPPPVVMSESERKWMLEHYDGNRRSEAKKALGRSKYDINRMAIELGLDSKG